MSTHNPSEMTLEAIRSVPLFGSLSDDAARELRSLLATRAVPRGTSLFHAGDQGDSMYLIESGRVRISVKDENQKEIILAELARGDFFGEMALIDGKRRSADATVIEEARVAILARERFLAFVRGNPDVALEMLSAVFERLRRTDELLQRRVSRNVNEEQEKRLTFADRAADVIAEFGGSWKFIGAFMLFLLIWVLINSWLLQDKGFDAFPYIFLNLVLAVVASLQAPVIMMSQNRQGEKDRLRSNMDYEVNLKNELALTEVLRRLDVLESERLPLLFGQQDARIAEVKAAAEALAGRETT